MLFEFDLIIEIVKLLLLAVLPVKYDKRNKSFTSFVVLTEKHKNKNKK